MRKTLLNSLIGLSLLTGPLALAPAAQAGSLGAVVKSGSGVTVVGRVHGRHYRPYRPVYRHHRRFHRRHHVYHHRGSNAGALVFGLGLGALAATAAQQSRQREVIVVQEPPRRRVRRGNYDPYRSAPRPEPVPRAGDDPFAGADCRQIREYQTVVIVGGEEVDAYGPACLQPDGSWLKGPLTVVPNS